MLDRVSPTCRSAFGQLGCFRGTGYSRKTRLVRWCRLERGETKGFHRQSFRWRSLEHRGGLQGDWIAYIRASNTTLVQDLDRNKRQKIRKEQTPRFRSKTIARHGSAHQGDRS